MDLDKIIQELYAEKLALDDAIFNLERLAAGRLRLPGRPPAWVVALRSKKSGSSKQASLAGKNGQGVSGTRKSGD